MVKTSWSKKNGRWTNYIGLLWHETSNFLSIIDNFAWEKSMMWHYLINRHQQQMGGGQREESKRELRWSECHRPRLEEGCHRPHWDQGYHRPRVEEGCRRPRADQWDKKWYHRCFKWNSVRAWASSFVWVSWSWASSFFWASSLRASSSSVCYWWASSLSLRAPTHASGSWVRSTHNIVTKD